MSSPRITLRSFVWGTVLCALFACVTLYLANVRTTYITSTQIPVLPYAVLFAGVLLINPLCRLVRVIRPFSSAEILVIFTMTTVSAGISTFGLSAQLLPMASSLFNPAWNNEQTRWNRTIVPFVNEDFFVSAEGIQEAARRHLEAEERAAAASDAYRAARALIKAEEDCVAARSGLDLAESAADESAAVVRAKNALSRTLTARESARRQWLEKRPEPGARPDAVAAAYGSLVAQYQGEEASAREELAVLEQAAFARVELYRRGLPETLRAFPGILPTGKDNLGAYAARVRRLLHGMRSHRLLHRAERAASSGVAAEARSLLSAAAAALDPIAGEEREQARRSELNRKLDELNARKAAQAEALSAAYQDRRLAVRETMRESDARIERLSEQGRALQGEEKTLRKDLEHAELACRMCVRARETRDAIRALSSEWTHLSPEETAARMAGISAGYGLFDGSLRRFLIGDLPWGHWAKVLGLWGSLIALTYVVLMSFNVLIFRQWAYNEKLIYPLAEIPEHLAGAEGEAGRTLPAVFRSGLFWTGFAVSAGFLGWNLLCYTQVIPGLKMLDFRNLWSPYLRNTIFEGLGWATRSEVFFTMIGLSFLIPKRISFSLWFFSLLYILQVLVLIWLGYGANEGDFPMDWIYVMNFRTAEGGGALLVFASLVLLKCRRYILCCVRPRLIADLDRDEQLELKISSFLFLGGSAGIVLLLWRCMGANVYYTVFFYLVILVITIGLVRCVTEGGLLGFQAWAGPFHFIRTLVGMNRAWTAPSLFAPLIVYHAMLFLDIKTFIAPAMANALKIRSDLRMSRGRFHASMVMAILVAVVVAVIAELMLGYDVGADRMSGWFYTGLPRYVYMNMSSMAQHPPEAAPEVALWVGAGAAVMAALLYFRQFFFWLPHPIGMIMLVNPLMSAYWFSILLGWIAKSLVTKYGSKDTYTRMRGLFLGLIVGELTIVGLSVILSLHLGIRIPIDLNRN